ncbi:ATP-binding protein [Streptomyces sp. NPDC057136]|uniref:ATP-binding protein n=1 Tax=Streptomyces sp. NPDC057136 TaxID=3346029 RepID=UPI00362F7F72
MPRAPEGVPECRRRVQEAMRDWGEPSDRVEAAALVVTELVANAVQHTNSRRIRCRLLRSHSGVRICVWNRERGHITSPTPPGDLATAPGECPEPQELPEDGRGLLLVDALAARWGTSAGLAGRLVWADI